ncbi:glutamine synthetase/guanido kinase [Penicillium angulare]|uniref:glutamine synthetase/guanido kinase n=1 Tax=Penicillium angulare TaxID=116970 RepID=UPI002541DC3A|nr:glutamine synthetase/guanido kinase [Penicillium angulare]KAJ5289172.1 glutamine synthetase/guanido kinase [Penicillium angulare]
MNETWKEIKALSKDVEFVWMQFIPFHGAMRVRMIPISEFARMVENGQTISIAGVTTHALRNDHIAKGARATSAIHLVPDIATASRSPRRADSHRLEIFARFAREDGSPIPECPRDKITTLTRTLHDQYGVYILVGYEIEVIFLKPEAITSSSDAKAPISNHCWSAVSSDVRSVLPLVEDVVRALHRCEISVQQYHAEATPGQWEFVLPPRPPLEAVDTLIRAREAIGLIAEQHGFRATLHPRPYTDQAGTGAHVHLSVNSVQSRDLDEKDQSMQTCKIDPFFAGIINHFCSLMAFCLPLDESYARVASGIWSGGEFVSWGWQNRETPLRRIAQNRFELKLHCGMANPYVSMAGLLAAGLDGLQRGMTLTAGDCQEVPSEMTLEEREKLGIVAMIPRSLNESLEFLKNDKALSEVLGCEYVNTYASVAEEWNNHVLGMELKCRRKWLLENY